MSTVFAYEICQQNQGHLQVSLSGVAGVRDILSMYDDVCLRAKEQQIDKILVDVTGCKLDYPMTQFVPLMKQLARILAPFRVARVCNVFEFRQDLIENISNKSSVMLKNFTCEQQAINWLLENKAAA